MNPESVSPPARLRTPPSPPSGATNPPGPGRETGAPDRSAGVEIVDVWSRTAPKYRIRAIALLFVNILLFAGMGSFANWLRSGEHFAPGVPGYSDQLVDTFRFTGNNGVTLGALLLKPISVQDVPLQIVIWGLLFAALISIPILVAILYRIGSALPFVAVVGLIAVLPWLAITLLGSCIIASAKPFRTRFRFVSALMGLVPTVIYFLLAWRGSADLIVGQVDPVDRIKFIAPWVLAVVAASLVFAIVLAIARLVDYRPGAITPLLAVMFGLPVILFEVYVGRDELYYRRLEDLHSAYFSDVDTSLSWQEAAWRAWERHPLPRPRYEVVERTEETKWLLGLSSPLAPYESELTRHQAEFASGCDVFLRSFPQSRYTGNVLYLKASAWSVRVDLPEFRRTKWIRFYDDFPNAAMRATWQSLRANGANSELAAVAGLRLAQLDAREGDVDRARDGLVDVIGRLAFLTNRPPQKSPPAGVSAANNDPDNTEGGRGAVKATSEVAADATTGNGAFERRNPEASLRVPLGRLLLDARRLSALLAANRDPIYGDDPLAGTQRPGDEFPYGLLDLDPRAEAYPDNLRRLLDKYPKAQVRDNLELELARSAPTIESTVAQLEALLQRHPSSDAVPEALFRLALAYRAYNDPTRSEETLVRLARDFPDCIWTQEAAGLLPRVAGAKLTRSHP